MEKFLMNLQRFAEPEEIVVETVDDEDEDDDTPVPPVVVTEPIANEPPVPMPSHVSNEAWRNVEELLVTLSNNVRVNMGEIVSLIRANDERSSDVMKRIEQSLGQMNVTMSEFKTLLESAIVDEPKENSPEPPKNNSRLKSGYLSRKKRG